MPDAKLSFLQKEREAEEEEEEKKQNAHFFLSGRLLFGGAALDGDAKPLFQSVGEAAQVDGPTKLLCCELIRETSCQSSN